MLLAINPDHPEPRKVRRAVDALEAGDVIAFPTDTLYALGCDLLNKRAIERLYSIKGMDREHPLAFLCPDLSEVSKYAIVENQTYRVLKHYLPGPYCFILEATREVPRMLQSKRKTIGIRVSPHPVTHALVAELGRPILSSSAHREGAEPHVDPNELDDDFKGLGLVLDGGGGTREPTTVIDLTVSPPAVLRVGAGSADDFVDEAPTSLRDMRAAMKKLNSELRR